MFKSINLLVLVNVLYLTYGAQNCGKSHISPDWRVIGGSDAAAGEFPWQVILTLVNKSPVADANNFCGGSIINERWILTAGHCVHLRNAVSTKIRLGVLNFTKEPDVNEVDILVEKLVPHQQFVQTFTGVSNDIALIKLSENLDFNGKHKHLSPICLATPTTEKQLTPKCIASGFGFVDTHRHRPTDGILQKVDEPYAENSLCEKDFAHFNGSQCICAGGSVAGGKAVCNGDSGGPLQCQATDGTWHQVGIVSYGRPCALPHIPDVFTKVSAFSDWIEKTVSSN